jgi:hypothetical protein
MPQANADDNQWDDENLMSPEACQEIPWNSAYKFHIYYNSKQGGAWRNIGYRVYNFDVLRPGGSIPNTYQLKFCSIGASSPWPGSGQRIKNNAASGENTHPKYVAHVYFNSGYKGAEDRLAPYEDLDRFRNVYNDNASFQWTS